MKGAAQTARSGLRLCCSQTPKKGFLASRAQAELKHFDINLLKVRACARACVRACVCVCVCVCVNIYISRENVP